MATVAGAEQEQRDASAWRLCPKLRSIAVKIIGADRAGDEGQSEKIAKE